MDGLRGQNFSSDEVKAAVHQWFQRGKKERLFKVWNSKLVKHWQKCIEAG
jgi:hypothetical protein